ncbi:LuxR C-terminal-related transcriptional regulator [Kribbella sp. NPDC023855]|uniref:ATP-binding protein n=1 Tax=Kribbella sp. NPDC023855 TaxID=3154698 RepID=UPI0033D2B7A4
MVPDGQVEISAREAEVLAAIAAHRSNAQIAHAFHISIRTVESHVSSLLRKYGVTDRRQLADLVAESRPGTAAAASSWIPGAAGGALAGSPSAGAGGGAGRGGAASGALGDAGVRGLPGSRTTFVGRAVEGAAVAEALREPGLVTLLGPGGMGKTRLAAVVAAAVAEEASMPGVFVDLVPVRAVLVARTVATALGVTERPPQTLAQALTEQLSSTRALLVLDNCEHLVAETAELVELLLDACPDLSVLATSRERLAVPGERVVQLEPLPAASDGVQLFQDRARAVDSNFTADPTGIARLCERLDGMPLAIELAAARTASLGIDGLLALDNQLRLLSGSRAATSRHRSLSAVIGWSHDLLDDEERLLFRRLGIYLGGVDLDAACATSPEYSRGEVADLIGRLTDKSLLVRRGARWRQLETVRAFALEQLETAGETATARERHLHWAATTAAQLESQLDKASSDWRVLFGEVVDDLRAALAATVAQPDPTAHRLARSLGHLAFASQGFVEAVGHYQAAADRAEDGVSAARDLRSAADVSLILSDSPATIRFLLEAAERAVVDGNVRATMLASAVITLNRYPAGAMYDTPRTESAQLLTEALNEATNDDPQVTALLATARAWEHGERRIGADTTLAHAAVDAARRSGDPVLIAGALDALCVAAGNAGRLREARKYALERLELVAPLPRHEPYAAAEIVDAYHVAATTAVATGNLPAALPEYQNLPPLVSNAGDAAGDLLAGDRSYLWLPRVIRLNGLTGRFDECIADADTLWARWERAGSPPQEWMSSALAVAAMVHGLRRDGSFEVWQRRALELARAGSDAAAPVLSAVAAFADARVAVHDNTRSRVLVEQAFAEFGELWWAPYAHAAGAELAVVAELPDAEKWLEAAATTAGENDWAEACLLRARGTLSGDLAVLRQAAERFAEIGARFEQACTWLLTPDRADDGLAVLAELQVSPPGNG